MKMAKKKQNNVSSNKCKKDMLNKNVNMKNCCNENEPNTEEEQPENELRQVVTQNTEIDLMISVFLK